MLDKNELAIIADRRTHSSLEPFIKVADADRSLFLFARQVEDHDLRDRGMKSLPVSQRGRFLTTADGSTNQEHSLRRFEFDASHIEACDVRLVPSR